MAKVLVGGNVVKLFEDREEVLPPVPLDVTAAMARPLPTPGRSDIDLTGRRKVWLVIAPGSAGKTHLLRWLGEGALDRDDGDPPVLMSIDPGGDLGEFFAKVPDGNGGMRSVVYSPTSGDRHAWLDKMLRLLVRQQKSAAIDFSGGDTTLADLSREIPGLYMELEESGLTPVVVYLLSPRVSDLKPLMITEASGFQPVTTVIALNCGRVSNVDPEPEFGTIRRQPEYQAVVERGAVEIWIPRNYAAAAIENRRLGFRQAMNHAAGADGTLLDGGNRRRNARWLQQMDDAWSGIRSWLL